ncbi:EmrB/QacA family drug resistance transporter [Cupriavidus basilensis OR16]|uniref:EmrB/QacA family drug resistance transporter n=1 Tax=Cupriavidus basilensis OR16 TaxID=1127483 RepID=H1S1Y2_9BURK|nr:MFS transporter [Cupriavidus basilensis]EHP43476.1 EmrB/QacA family drug resistance transporter [Cupriavidus basilensis OR16]
MPLSTRQSVIIALIVASAYFMENLDATVIATALPHMAATFGVTPVGLSIGMTAYLLAIAVFIPISGWVADRFGQRSVFGGAIVVFTGASVLCGLSNGLVEFTVARILQGVGGAMMVPVGRLAVLRSTEKHHLMRSIAYITWPGLAAPVVGPALGGFISTYFSWRWIFLLNVPIGLLGLALTATFIPNYRASTHRPFDVSGFVLSGVALICLMYGMELVGQLHSDWRITVAALTCGAGAAALAIRHLGRAAHPLIDLSPWRIPTFRVTLDGGSLYVVSVSVSPFLLPLLFQLGFGLNSFAAGLLVLAYAAGNLGMKSVTTPILKRFGYRNVMIVNGLLTAATIAMCSLISPSTPRVLITLVLLIGGLCRSMQFTGINTLAFADVPPARMSSASTFFSMVQQMTIGLGIAFGAIALHAAVLVHGNHAQLSLADFRVAFLLVAVLVLISVLYFIGIEPDAGREVSGHTRTASR